MKYTTFSNSGRAYLSILFTIVLLCLMSYGAGAQYVDIGNDPLEWLREPHSVYSKEVFMSVKPFSGNAVPEYKFECVEGSAASSSWQSSNEYRVSGLQPQSTHKFIARVRNSSTGEELLPPTREIRVTTRRATNYGYTNNVPEIDQAFAKGEIELIPIRVTGDKDNRINIATINRWHEGQSNAYNTPALRDDFIEHSKHAFRTFVPGDELAIAPMPEYRDFYNQYAIWWSGMPPWDTQSGMNHADYQEIRDRLFLPWREEGRGWATVLAMYNGTGGGGGAGLVQDERVGDAYIVGRETTAFIHEFAHTALGIPDEYTSNGLWGRGGPSSSTTLDYTREEVKWKAWIDQDTPVPTPYSPEYENKVGVFEGATHRVANLYRPTARGCIMGAGSYFHAEQLCPICRQRATCRTYIWVNPFDSLSPARKELTINESGTVHFSIDVIKPSSETQKLSWYLNGSLIAEGVTEIDVTFDQLEKYELECRLVDETKFVRPDPPFVDYPRASVQWTIVNNDAGGTGSKFAIDQNGANNLLYDGDLKNDKIEPIKTMGETKTPLYLTSDLLTSVGKSLSAEVEELIASTGNQNNGSVCLKVEGGVTPYTYEWFDGSTTNSPCRDGLTPGTYSVEIEDSVGTVINLDFEIEKVEEFFVHDLYYQDAGDAGSDKMKIYNPEDDYTYLWYKDNAPNSFPGFPNGHYYGTCQTEQGETYQAKATVVYNTGGVFLQDKENNDFGNWIQLKIYSNGADSLPIKFELNTNQDGRYAKVLTIDNEKTNKIVIDNNYRYASRQVDITWNGVVKNGYMELAEQGFLNSTLKLSYSSDYPGKEEPIATGLEFTPTEPGNYYVAAQSKETGAISMNRRGFAISEVSGDESIESVDPRDVESSDLIMWLDGNDLNADGKPDGKLLRRGSASGGQDKAGDLTFHWFNYFPNEQNGKPVLSWATLWLQGLSDAVNNYQTIMMVRRENGFSHVGTAPYRRLNSYIGVGEYGGNLFDSDISSRTLNGRVRVNGETIDPLNFPMPKDFYIATYEFDRVLNNSFKNTSTVWEGDVAEMLVFNSTLSEEELKGLEEYLRKKWLSWEGMKADTAAPGVPANLNASADDEVVYLSWDENTEEDLKRYYVYRSTAPGSGYSLIDSTFKGNPNYRDDDVTNNTTYYYVITAVDIWHKESGFSDETFATPADTEAPYAPTNLKASTDDDQVVVDLIWDENRTSDLEGYHVYRSTTQGSGYSRIDTTLVIYPNYLDEKVANNTTCYYVVTAVDNWDNESGFSNEASATPSDAKAPKAPVNLEATVEGDSVNLAWDENREGDLAGYYVYRASSSSESFSKLNTSLIEIPAYTDNNASGGTTYYYQVTAVDTVDNESDCSSAASATLPVTSVIERNSDSPGIRVYPNPRDEGKLFIEWEGISDEVTITIRDVSGVTVYQELVSGSKTSIPAAKISEQGFYIISVVGDQYKFDTKLLVR